MGSKTAVRHLVDLLMTVVLVLLMAYFLTEQEIHEWLGAGMLVLFIAHHILNRKWLKALNRGKYTPSGSCRPPSLCWSFCVCWAPCSAGSG